MNPKEYKKELLRLSRQKTPLEEEYGYDHDDKKVDNKLSKILRNIAYVKPDPIFYATAWQKAFFDSPDIAQDCASTALKYFSKCDLINKLSNRQDSNLLIAQIYSAKCIFEPLILIENQKFTDTDKKYSLCYPDPFTLNTELYKVSNILKEYVKANGLNDTLSRYVSKIKYDGMLIGTDKVEISRAQFTITVMMLSNMTEYDTIIATNKSKIMMSGMGSRKPTKILTHTLCCIIYNLLQKHSKNDRQRQKGYCRELTAEIVNYISPKDENQYPYSNITRRGVEVALTGK